MSDQFCDRRTYMKKNTSTNLQAKQDYNRHNMIYKEYARIVGVKEVNDAFKSKVDDFRQFFTVSSFQRPSGLIKTQWKSFYEK